MTRAEEPSLGAFLSVCQAFCLRWELVDGCLINDPIPARAKWVQRALAEGFTRTNVERHLNHAHADGLLVAPWWHKGPMPSDADYEALCKIHAAMNLMTIRQLFPQLDLDFALETDASGLLVTIFQRRDDGPRPPIHS